MANKKSKQSDDILGTPLEFYAILWPKNLLHKFTTYLWTSIGGEVQNCTGVVSLRPQTQDSSSLLQELEAVVLPPALWTYNLDDLWELEVASGPSSTSGSTVSSSLITSDHFRFSAALFLLFLTWILFSNGVLVDCFFFRLRWPVAPSMCLDILILRKVAPKI